MHDSSNKMTNIAIISSLLLLISCAASLSISNSTLDIYKNGHHGSCNSEVQVKEAKGDWKDIEYDDDDSCSWKIESTSGVALYIDHVAQSSNQLMIYDGPDDSSDAFEELTFDSQGSYFYSSGKEMLIKFVNHNDDTSALSKKPDVFEVEYIEADDVEAKYQCSGDQYIFATTGWKDLFSPYYQETKGHGNNNKMMLCSWIFHSSAPQNKVMVQFEDVDLRNGDSLTLFDGQNSQDGNLIGSISMVDGVQLIQYNDGVMSDNLKNTFQSTGRYLFVEYISNEGHQDARGVHMQYRSITDDEFITTTPASTTTIEPPTVTHEPSGPSDSDDDNDKDDDSDDKSVLKPGVMTALWILLFFAIILICPLIYKLVSRCCGSTDTRPRNRGDDGSRWVVTTDMAQDNAAFKKDDLPPSYDTLSVRSLKMQDEKMRQEEAGSSNTSPPPSYNQHTNELTV